MKINTPAERYEEKMKDQGYVKTTLYIHSDVLKIVDGLSTIIGSRSDVIERSVERYAETLKS